jgi:hypothetical protein
MWNRRPQNKPTSCKIFSAYACTKWQPDIQAQLDKSHNTFKRMQMTFQVITERGQKMNLHQEECWVGLTAHFEGLPCLHCCHTANPETISELTETIHLKKVVLQFIQFPLCHRLLWPNYLGYLQHILCKAILIVNSGEVDTFSLKS